MRVTGETTAIMRFESSLVPRHLHPGPAATDLGNDLVQAQLLGDPRLNVHLAGMKLARLRRGAAVEMDVATWQKRSVDNVHTFGFGSGRTSAGLTRIAYVFGSSQCLQGLECGSSPTSGTVFCLFRGF
jgi:hypothetical protein